MTTIPHVDLLDPEAMSRIGRLDLIAGRIVEGFLSGKHKSPFKGSSVEFAEHRDYSPGDDTRLLDWRVFARRDRYCIKQYEDETNLQCLLVLDASGSMGFGLSTVPKVRYAQMALACLARLMLLQRDAVGLAVIDQRLRSFIPPRSSVSHFRIILDALGGAKSAGETAMAGQLHDLARRTRRRGMILIASDCFEDPEPLLGALRHLRYRGHEVVLFHIVAPEETSLEFDRWSRFEDLEIDGHRMDVDPAAIRKDYLDAVRRFLERLRLGCGEVGCDYVPMTTRRPLGDALAWYLWHRAARLKQ